MADPATFDDLVIGSGMGGLTVAALLAESGRRVLVLEAHDTAGGYAHTFRMGKYRFCAQVHYIFGCGEGEPVDELLRRIGLRDQVRFHRLDPEGFDQIVVSGTRFRIPAGFSKFRDRLVRRFPEAKEALWRYFATIMALREELALLPDRISWRDWLSAPFRFPKLLKYRNATLQELYDEVAMPAELQAVLAGQSGDYLLPPEKVSLLLHVALIVGYDNGAYYPEKHYSHLVDSVTDRIGSRPGCSILFEREVSHIRSKNGRVSEVQTKSGEIFRAERYISNVDPRKTMELLEGANDARPDLSYGYSCSNFTLYLGVKGLDLRDHGFGAWNVWHYPHLDLNRMYRDQLDRRDLSNPWLFMSTPTLHTDAPGLAPPGHQILEVATACSYEHFEALRAEGRASYSREKRRVRDRIIDIIEESYVPGLREHLAIHVAGTPLTNETFCRSPRGNAYGSELTPENMRARVDFETPIENLFLVNATAGFPSIGGTVGAGLKLFARLSGARA
ncbi:MAG: NAD(P)/FAD-dependent oxidoreductase [Deltaproteobacteria bacterium]|nr:NAD(P)/FAD-dependent oxidoreductase [Deltaproteobacteria bacterium]